MYRPSISWMRSHEKTTANRETHVLSPLRLPINRLEDECKRSIELQWVNSKLEATFDHCIVPSHGTGGRTMIDVPSFSQEMRKFTWSIKNWSVCLWVSSLSLFVQDKVYIVHTDLSVKRKEEKSSLIWMKKCQSGWENVMWIPSWIFSLFFPSMYLRVRDSWRNERKIHSHFSLPFIRSIYVFHCLDTLSMHSSSDDSSFVLHLLSSYPSSIGRGLHR